MKANLNCFAIIITTVETNDILSTNILKIKIVLNKNIIYFHSTNFQKNITSTLFNRFTPIYSKRKEIYL